MNRAIILFAGKKISVICDRNCSKAWGINKRPGIEFDPNDPDDSAMLADHELGTAPVDPGTYEGGEAKPLSADHFPNKWCVRECERCVMSNSLADLHNFNSRVYNQPWKHKEINNENQRAIN